MNSNSATKLLIDEASEAVNLVSVEESKGVLAGVEQTILSASNAAKNVRFIILLGFFKVLMGVGASGKTERA